MIELTDVYKVYPNNHSALKGINVNISEGEFVFIIGPSGAGKSTILKLLLREISATSGTVKVNGYNLHKIRDSRIPYFRRTLGVIFQDFRLIPEMTVYENVAFALRAIGSSKKVVEKHVPSVLSIVGLSQKHNSLPGELSAGEQQRTALARAIVNAPDLIIADEPTGNVDPKMSQDIMKLLVEINNLGTTVVVVTHDRQLVDQYKKRVISIRSGKVVDDRIGGYYDGE